MKGGLGNDLNQPVMTAPGNLDSSFQKKLIQSQQKENELKMNIYAYQDLVQRKEEEIAILQE